MEKRRRLLIAAALLCAVLVALTAWHLLGPQPPSNEQVLLETRCMAALNEWTVKRKADGQPFAECEAHFSRQGNTMQAAFFAQAIRLSAGKTDDQLQLETLCFAALAEWQKKRAARTPLFTRCEAYFIDHGDTAQAAVFGQAKVDSGGK